MKRRKFLKASSAAIASAGLISCGGGDTAPSESIPTNDTTPTDKTTPIDKTKPDGSAPVTNVEKTFYITDGRIRQIDGVDVYFRGFSSSQGGLNIPGESLIIREGDTIKITVINKLTTPHNFTINNINRVADKDETINVDIAPQSSEVISFTAGAPGTYLYYDNSNNEPYNRLLGLHGAIAVLPLNSDNELYPGSKTFKKQLFWIFNDIDPVWNNALERGIKPNPSINPFKPQYFTMNGLGGRPPGAPGNLQPDQNSMIDPRTKLDGSIGDRTLIRCINVGMAKHSVHIHANHMEWLTTDGKARTTVWEKDIVPLNGNGGRVDVIYPFEAPPDCVHNFTEESIIKAEAEGREILYAMHLHDEMTQTAGGSAYLFGAITDVHYLPK